MYLCTFTSADGRPRLGARLGPIGAPVVELDRVHSLVHGRSNGALGSMLALIAAGAAGLELARAILEHARAGGVEEAVHAPSSMQLLAPIPRPPRLRNFSVYEGHLKRSINAAIELRAGRAIAGLARALRVTGIPRDFYARPGYYKGNHLSIVGPDADVTWPRYAKWLDYELELAFVIGKAGLDVPAERAMEHVFGYTILNDVSARDTLMDELMGRLGPAKGKDFDTGNVIGPWLATRDEIRDPHALRGTVKVNGELRGSCTTSDMHHRIEAMIVEASRGETLVPGELFGTGACTYGAGIEDKRFLAAGDVMELELESLGVLRNRLVRGATA